MEKFKRRLADLFNPALYFVAAVMVICFLCMLSFLVSFLNSL